MTDLILPRLPKSLQILYIDYGRGVLMALGGVLALVVFIGLYEMNGEKVTRHAMLPVIDRLEHIADNRSPETLFTVRTPTGGTAQLATQSPAILRDARAMICAEELRASDGTTHWEASPRKTCE